MNQPQVPKAIAMNKAADDNRRPNGRRESVPAPTGRPAPARRPSGSSALHVYKPGQGAYLRWGTAAGAGIAVVGLAAFLREQLTRVQNEWVQTLIPAGVMVLLGYLAFRLLGQSRSVVDFMIATEGEMKKVNWSTRREVLGATKVVIATVIALGVILFVVDLFFMFFFETIDVLRIGMTDRLFGGGVE
jgi:preprotein translocase SecE subunit